MKNSSGCLKSILIASTVLVVFFVAMGSYNLIQSNIHWDSVKSDVIRSVESDLETDNLHRASKTLEEYKHISDSDLTALHVKLEQLQQEKNRNMTSIFSKDYHLKLDGDIFYFLQSASGLSQAHPTIYTAPNKDDLDQLKVGNNVLVLFDLSNGHDLRRVKMWVNITAISPTSYTGKISSETRITDQLPIGMEVIFESDNIFEIASE